MNSISDALRKATRQTVDVPVDQYTEAGIQFTELLPSTAYVVPTELMSIADAAYVNKQTVICVGPPGTGKTTFWEYFAKLKQTSYMRKSIEADTEASELGFVRQVGYSETGQASIVFELSNVLEFLQHPGILVIDEPFQSLSGSCLAPMRPILDEGKYAIPDGRTIIKHPECMIVFTDNTKGAGENYEKYQRNIQDASLINRIDLCIEFDYLAKCQEVPLIRSLCGISLKAAEQLWQLADLTRAAYRKGELSRLITLRQIKAVGMLRIPVDKALLYVFRNTLTTDTELQAYDAMVAAVY